MVEVVKVVEEVKVLDVVEVEGEVKFPLGCMGWASHTFGSLVAGF